jgi:hypothetical protein
VVRISLLDFFKDDSHKNNGSVEQIEPGGSSSDDQANANMYIADQAMIVC